MSSIPFGILKSSDIVISPFIVIEPISLRLAIASDRTLLTLGLLSCIPPVSTHSVWEKQKKELV